VKTLIKFFVNYGIYFLFVLLEVGALLLVVNYNSFQRSVFLSSSNAISGTIYDLNQSVADYFSLRRVNKELVEENNELHNQLLKLDNEISSLETDSLRGKIITFLSAPEKEFTCYSAKVINNSTNKLRNYITLNRGKRDGIKPEMTVTGAQGAIGVVKSVSEHFSVVMPILNPKSQTSCKIKGRNQSSESVVKDIGSLVWDGENPRYANMLQVPRHVNIQQGDTVITSGYSDFFPEGILVGIVDNFEKADDDNYYDIRVRLAVDFSTISYVNVFDYKYKNEQEELEMEAQK
jgi:rod shape-determining protein MreC